MRKKEILNSPIFNGDIFPNPIDIHVGQRIRERRMRIGMSQEKLAEATNVTFQQVQKYESAKNRVSASRLYQFSLLLGVSVDYFYEGIDLRDGSSGGDSGLSDNIQDAFAGEQEGAASLNTEERKLCKAYFSVPDKSYRAYMLKLVKEAAKMYGLK